MYRRVCPDKSNEKPASVNGFVDELEIISSIIDDNNGATVKLAWIRTVGETSVDDYRTIQEAINDVGVGNNIIVVYPGDYGTESIRIEQDNNIHIELVAFGQVTLKNPILIDGKGSVWADQSLTIKGFTFDFPKLKVRHHIY